MNMGIPFEIAAEGMQRADDSRSKGLLMILAVKPVGNDLGRCFKKDSKQAAVPSEKLTELLGDGKDNVPVAAVDELGRDRICSVSLVSRTAGIAEAGFTAERHKAEVIAVRTAIQSIALFQIPTMKHFLNLGLHNRANAPIGRDESGPVILKNLLDGKL